MVLAICAVVYQFCYNFQELRGTRALGKDCPLVTYDTLLFPSEFVVWLNMLVLLVLVVTTH